MGFGAVERFVESQQRLPAVFGDDDGADVQPDIGIGFFEYDVASRVSGLGPVNRVAEMNDDLVFGSELGFRHQIRRLNDSAEAEQT